MAKYQLKLYVIGHSLTAKKAIANLKKICQRPELANLYEPVVVDLLLHPKLAEREKIIATPMLIKELPEPIRRVIGDLSDYEKVLVGLDLYES